MGNISEFRNIIPFPMCHSDKRVIDSIRVTAADFKYWVEYVYRNESCTDFLNELHILKIVDIDLNCKLIICEDCICEFMPLAYAIGKIASVK